MCVWSGSQAQLLGAADQVGSCPPGEPTLESEDKSWLLGKTADALYGRSSD